MSKISDECIFEGVARYNFKNNNYPLLETAKINFTKSRQIRKSENKPTAKSICSFPELC